MPLSKIRKNQKWRPQNGKIIRELREQLNLRQSEFAEEINSQLKENMPNIPSSEILTQTMVSELERENADLRILHLLTFSNFFGVRPETLLNRPLQHLKKSDSFIGDGSEETFKDEKLAQCLQIRSGLFCPSQEKHEDSFWINSTFPSTIFMSDQCTACHTQTREHNSSHMEFYPLETLISFLFSPIKKLGKKAKIETLDRVLSFFHSSIHRHLFFIPPSHEEDIKTPALHIHRKKGHVYFLLGERNQDIKYIKLDNPDLADKLYHNYEKMPLIKDGLTLLSIAKDVLLSSEKNTTKESINLYYQQCQVKTNHAHHIKECFAPDYFE